MLGVFSLGGGVSGLFAGESQPNVLWIVTDDQRYDSIRAFNRIIDGREHSALGYVESPEVDKLAAQGTTFINTYCHSPGCAPSRAAMHFGRYPWHSGIYEFEYHNASAPHWQPPFPEKLAAMGYQTFHVGKRGVRLKEIQADGQSSRMRPIYQQSAGFKELHLEGLTAWGKGWFSKINGQTLEEPFQSLEYFYTPEDGFTYLSERYEETFPAEKGKMAAAMERYDILRHYNEKKGKHIDSGMILAGVSARPAGETRDGFYVKVLADYLRNEGQPFREGKLTYQGVDPDKPLFCHLGFDFPHTPVLPPQSFRERFQQKTYQIPSIVGDELETMPKQMRKMVTHGFTDHFSAEEKQKMVQDYFAFCAYGDSLVGQAVDEFVKFSEGKGQEWMVVYVCGDHGWKLNEHGSVSKFTPWRLDTLNPIIVVSSDKKAFPAGKVVRDFTEFVDIAPTVLAAGGADLASEEFAYLDGRDLARVAAGELPPRDYVVGESHAVTGPRAFIRTAEYLFTLQSRRGKNMDWARTAAYEELDPGLYHLPSDPQEVKNLAFSPEHQEVARKMKEKLIAIVLGDGRVEVDWGGPKALGTGIFRSNFAPGANDGKLKL
ncbi:sulfatase-like hydrolase/transferase [Roseibacillus ishigakijimensis]|uniref:Sulfatase-like hydrolase/transferase n=2 Tax=Roseibacillus ishigakijimensis TaxID=454146 RepID=A0A934RQY7_9BACT|nr:sulfatase-like hydrolase/transferase [Roseibacillus ishigakijimensis]MBK1833833.1 sulfatase-like hydrolase/transferase [Roseibacillus ishigakijimensis]